jgi:hypothetical protein
MVLAAQAPVTLFAVLFLDVGLRGRSRTTLVLTASAIAVLLGALLGYHGAVGQYRFL